MIGTEWFANRWLQELLKCFNVFWEFILPLTKACDPTPRQELTNMVDALRSPHLTLFSTITVPPLVKFIIYYRKLCLSAEYSRSNTIILYTTISFSFLGFFYASSKSSCSSWQVVLHCPKEWCCRWTVLREHFSSLTRLNSAVKTLKSVYDHEQ